jgi:hypothetical protein
VKESTKEYTYIKMMFEESGLDFKNIPKEDLVGVCKSYDGKINNKNYITALKVIDDLYRHIN